MLLDHDNSRALANCAQGTSDQVYSVANAEEEIKLFVNAKKAELVVVDGGFHFLSASDPDKVEPAIIDFLKKQA